MSCGEHRPRPYVYRAVCRRVIDGDTIVFDIDLGDRHWLLGCRVRLLGVDTPNTWGETEEVGLAVAAFVRQILPAGRRVIIESRKRYKLQEVVKAQARGKYGRLLGIVWVNGTETLNDLLVAQGWGEKEKEND